MSVLGELAVTVAVKVIGWLNAVGEPDEASEMEVGALPTSTTIPFWNSRMFSYSSPINKLPNPFSVIERMLSNAVSKGATPLDESS